MESTHRRALKKTLTGHSSGIRTVAFAPNGGTLASGDDSGTIRLWNVDTGELLKTIETESDTIDSVVYSPDGKTLVSTGNNGDDGIRFWNVDVDTGELLKNYHRRKGCVRCRIFPGW